MHEWAKQYPKPAMLGNGQLSQCGISRLRAATALPDRARLRSPLFELNQSAGAVFGIQEKYRFPAGAYLWRAVAQNARACV